MPSKSSQPSLMPSCAPQTYNQDSAAAVLGPSNELEFLFTGLEPAIEEVVITYFHKGDNSPSGTYDLKAGSFSLGNSQTGQLTACTVDVASPTTDPVTAAEFNGVYMTGGVLMLSMVYDDFGGNNCTTGQQAFVRLEYQFAGCTSTMPSSMPSVSSKPSLSSMPTSMPSKSSQPSLMPSCAPQTYNQDSAAAVLGPSNELEFLFTGLEPAIGEVVITYFHKGDNSPSGTYDLKAGSFSLGNSQTGQFTACTVDVASPTTDPVTAAEFNGVYMTGGVLMLSMVYDDFGGNNCTTGQQAYVRLEYQFAGC
jgi:hypothetical protein